MSSEAARGPRVVVAALPHLHTATVAAFVKVGARHETAENNGISHFLEHIVFRGTERYPSSYALNLAIEDLGGSLDGETHADMTVFHASVPPEHAAEAVRVLGEMLSRPSFRDIEIERRIVSEEILEDLDEDGRDVNADNAARRLLFAPHPLGLPIPGPIGNLERFDARSLRAHHAERYVGENVLVVAAGAVDEARIADEATRAFEGLPQGRATVDERPEEAQGDRFLWIDDTGSQSDVRVSFRTFGETDPRSAALHLLARILHDGLASMVPHRISDEAGLAYEAFASLETWADAGALDFGASVAHDKAGDVLAAFADLCDELRRDGPTKDDLERTKRRWRHQLEAQRDDAFSTAFYYGTSSIVGRAGEDPAAFAARAAAVTLDEVHEVAAEILAPRRLHAVCVGDRRARRRALRAFEEAAAR